MSFDDLAYHGFRPESRYTFCYTCQADVSVPITQLYSDDDAKRICPQCQQRLPQQQRDDIPTTTGNGNAQDGQQLMQQLFTMNLQQGANTDTPQFIPFPRGMGQDTYADMVAAQQGVDVEALIQSLLQTSSYNAPPTSDKFIQTLQNRELTPKDFVQTVIRIRGLDRDIFPTTAEFGAQLIDKHDTNDTHAQEQIHITNVVHAATPIEGQGIKNGNELKYHVVVMKRGKISFVEKARVAQRAGCIALIVVQTDDLWPYTMNDSTKSAHDIVIPCLMINQKDGEIMISNSERFSRVESVSGGDEKTALGCEIKIMTRDRTLACPVCRDDFEVNFQAVKLPCDHYYCKDCITPWLEKRSTCPLCRYQLPTADKKLNERTDPNGAHHLMQQAMFT